MSGTETEKTAATTTKKKSASKLKEPASHPKYSEMIKTAVGSLKERGGSSRQAILKYIMSHYDVGKDEKVVNQHLKMSLRASVKRGSLKQSKGTGASGSFRLGEAAKKGSGKAKRAKKPQAAAAKKAKKPKAIGEKKAVKQSKGTKKAKSADKGKKGTGKAKKAAAKTKKPTKDKLKAQEESKQ